MFSFQMIEKMTNKCDLSRSKWSFVYVEISMHGYYCFKKNACKWIWTNFIQNSHRFKTDVFNYISFSFDTFDFFR